MWDAARTRYVDYDEGDEEEYCSVCGGYLDWVDCWYCHGEGEFDLYEQDCFAYEPGEVERCEVCNGEGGYLECMNLPHKLPPTTP